MGRSRPEPVMPVTEVGVCGEGRRRQGDGHGQGPDQRLAAPLRDQPGYECSHGTASEPKVRSAP